MTDKLALAERVERATGAVRELDCLILEALGYKVNRHHGRMGHAVRGIGPLPYVGRTHWTSVSRYTASIDEAMTLVPEGAEMLLDNTGCHCRLTRDDWHWLGFTGLAETMPLAVAAAALRAQAAIEQGERG